MRALDRAAAPAAVAVLAVLTVGAGVVAARAGSRPAVELPFLPVPGGGLGVAVDGLSAVLVVTVCVVGLAVTVVAGADDEVRAAPARFFAWWLTFVVAMLLTVTATTVPALLLGWEVMGATSAALIAFRWRSPATVHAASTAFLTTRAADTGLYVAAGALLAGSGGLALGDVARLDQPWAAVAATGVVVAALGKSAQLPFSGWLSGAMLGPTPVSAMLHSATMVAAGGYLLLRLSDALTGAAGGVVAWAGAGTAVVLGTVALAQRDLKQLLAASTAAQLGLVVLAAGAGATTGGAEHLVGHAVVKAGLFVAAGAWLSALGTRRLDGLRGAARRTPALGAATLVAGAALAGVPPLVLWVTKDEIVADVEVSPVPGAGALHVLALVATALAAAYAGKVLGVVVRSPAPGDRLDTDRLDTDRPGTRHVPARAVVVAAALAAASVALGALALPLPRPRRPARHRPA
ncbi:proton-conducting transporter membrane subunit [Cellulosimicrobium sp. CUA-896]|uniref:proton-conducting transporter transmembrane domain-containing protein n=1 Tax=Cellulosimicrobium sp. CUA-896 TaxID=1517881 RepID=UPI0009614D44|nr:proton-conducting transporter membrane subunit [Cellulosimicrobium sp. CUA-896]OLT51711.1 hypothetical protein BJF88_14855 [Cellulosimicrobium sp. CUA-896]